MNAAAKAICLFIINSSGVFSLLFKEGCYGATGRRLLYIFFTLSIRAHQVLQILLILVANVLQEIRVKKQVVVLRNGPGLGVNLGVVYGELDLQMSEIRAPEAFDNMKGIAVRTAAGKNPLVIIEARRIDNQRVAVPFSDGVSRPGGIGIFGKFASIHEDLAIGRL